MDLQIALMKKGGFNFLLYMFNTINKEADFDKDILMSKTLQLIIFILDRLHVTRYTQQLSQVEKPQHLNELLNGSLTIVNSFLKSVIV